MGRSFSSKAKEQAAKVITEELGEPLNPRQNPILQLVELVLVDGRSGFVNPPPQIEITDQEWEESYLGRENLEKVVNRIINGEQIAPPRGGIEDLRYWAAEIVALVVAGAGDLSDTWNTGKGNKQNDNQRTERNAEGSRVSEGLGDRDSATGSTGLKNLTEAENKELAEVIKQLRRKLYDELHSGIDLVE